MSKVLCRICGKPFQVITFSHLKKHNLTSREYHKFFPNAPFFSEDVLNKWNRVGKNNPMYGKHPIPWNKGKKGVQKSPKKGLTWEQYYGKEKAKKIKKKYNDSVQKNLYKWKRPLTEEHKKKLHLAKWQGGLSFEPYSPEFNNQLRTQIKERDNFECQYCDGSGIELCIHHIDYNKKNNKQTNLVTLCRGCNSIMNFNRKDWTKYWSRWMEQNHYYKTIVSG